METHPRRTMKDLVKETASLLTKVFNVFIRDDSFSFKRQVLDLT